MNEKKTNSTESIHLSPNQQAWRKFKKNKFAMAGFCVILLISFFAIFAYLIIPDNSQNANQIFPSLKLQNSGYSIKTIEYPLIDEQQSMFNQLFFGKKSSIKAIPIQDFNVKGDSLYFNRYLGPGLSGIKESMALASFPGGFDKSEHIKSRTFVFGSDNLGRDFFSRLILGCRVSISVGFMAVLISAFIGLFFGSIAGYFRGWPDRIIMYVINVFWSIPTLLLALSLAFVLDGSLSQVYLAIGLTMWIDVARIVRGQILSIREMEYVQAAKAMGFKHFRTIFRHILPNITGPLIVILASNFAAAILLEAGLSFLGLGVERPTPSWGQMLADNRSYLIAGRAQLAILPGLFISALVLSFFLFGNGLRDAFDVKRS